jgi:hypothetical protein
VSEIASAFVSSHASIEKRITRGKRALAGSKRLFDIVDAVAIGDVHDEVEGGFHVGRCQSAAVLETHVAAEVENIGEGIGLVPGFGQVTVKIHLRVALKKAAEEETVDSCGLRVGGVTRIEIGGIGFDEESQGGRIGVRA